MFKYLLVILLHFTFEANACKFKTESLIKYANLSKEYFTGRVIKVERLRSLNKITFFVTKSYKKEILANTNFSVTSDNTSCGILPEISDNYLVFLNRDNLSLSDKDNLSSISKLNGTRKILDKNHLKNIERELSQSFDSYRENISLTEEIESVKLTLNIPYYKVKRAIECMEEYAKLYNIECLKNFDNKAISIGTESQEKNIFQRYLSESGAKEFARSLIRVSKVDKNTSTVQFYTDQAFSIKLFNTNDNNNLNYKLKRFNQLYEILKIMGKKELSIIYKIYVNLFFINIRI